MVPQEDATFIFRVFDTFLGRDRRSTTTFGPVHGNLTEAVLGVDWSDYSNVAYVGGEGEDESRLVAPVISPALFNGVGSTPYERSEAFVDMPDATEDSVLESEGRSYIARNTAKMSATGKLVHQPSSAYGRDFFYGDLVRCDFGMYVFDAAISSVHVRVAFDEEDVEIILTSSGDDNG